MNKKKIIIISFLIVVAVIVAIAISKVANKTKNEGGAESQLGNKDYDYESIGLKEYSFYDDEETEAFQKIQGKIDAIDLTYLNELKMLVDNTIYDIDNMSSSFKKPITFDKKYTDFFKAYSQQLFLKDKNEDVMCYTAFDDEILFEGLDSKDLLYIEVPENSGTEEIRVIKKSNNDFYLEKYEVKNQKLKFVGKYDLVLRMLNSTEERDDIKNISCLDNGQSALITLSDNSAYEAINLFYNITEDGKKAIIRNSSYTKLSNVAQIYAQDTDFGKIAYIYTQTEDKNNIYLYTSKDYISGDMISTPIALPEGYKTSDIKNVIFNDMSILIEFNDKNIYLSSDIDKENSEMNFREACSKLNKDNKILDLKLPSSSKIVLLLDNNKLYVDRND